MLLLFLCLKAFALYPIWRISQQETKSNYQNYIKFNCLVKPQKLDGGDNMRHNGQYNVKIKSSTGPLLLALFQVGLIHKFSLTKNRNLSSPSIRSNRLSFVFGEWLDTVALCGIL